MPRAVCIRVALLSGSLILLCSSTWSYSGAAQSATRESPEGRVARQVGTTGPLSPEEALATFQLEPGYRIELVASEPLVVDPVAIAFDARGRMYVAEMRGYPDPGDGSASPPARGVVALLEDTDGDGRYDKRSDFAEGLTYPNGVMAWKGGVFVSCAPDLFYFKDTTGDGRADVREVILTGFSAERTAQNRFSHPTLAIDNWVYLTSGYNGGDAKVTAPAHPERPPVEFARNDSRFDPFTFEFEVVGGHAQYGLTFDDFGHRFICSNRHPVLQVVFERRYLERNPHLAFSETTHEVSKVGPEAVVWPIGPDTTTAQFHPRRIHVGTFTAASGVHLHRGDALPKEDYGSIFICESAQNLVQRQVRTSSGATFASTPARDGADFLASPDSWFRPVFATNGPDGALYIADMYRGFIDHPRFIPEASRAQLDFDAGRGYGRIYRIVATDWKSPRNEPFDLTQAAVEELSQTLEHSNAWWRETAQRLLIERQDRAALPHLRHVLTGGRTSLARVHALWTLDGLGGLEHDDLLHALADEDAGVRENAVRLAETRLAGSPALLARVLALADDPEARVRFRVALALGESDDPRATAALAAVARRDGDQRWTRAAVLSAIGNRAGEFLQAFAASPPSPAITAAVMQDLGQIFGAGQPPEQCVDLLLHITDPANDFAWQPAALTGIAAGLRTRGYGQGQPSPLMALVSGRTPKARDARARLEAVLRRSAAIAPDERQPHELRLAATTLLGSSTYAASGETLTRLLEPQRPAEIQMAAVRSLGRLQDPAAGLALVAPERWHTYTPQVREAVLSVLLANRTHLPALLGAIEKGDVAATALGPARRDQLLKHRDAAIQERATKVFADMTSGDRMQVYEQARTTVLALAGKPDDGQQVFARQCAVCHSFGGSGGKLGPDLSGISSQPADAILLHVLVPNYEITPGYDAYLVETKDGRTLYGLLESESPTSITLRDASNAQHAILRSNIASMSASPSSLMPNELERTMSPVNLADLVAYLKRPPRLTTQERR